MIHHPQKELIEKYSSGELATPLAVMIACHLDTCQECHLKHKKNLERNSNDFLLGLAELSLEELNGAFDHLMKKLHDNNTNLNKPSHSDSINIHIFDQIIELPYAMNFLKGFKISWKTFGKMSAIAPIIMSSRGNFYFIYIGPGQHVPLHNHTGIEYSYVISGAYEDGYAIYRTGDFSISTHELTHAPRAISQDGCFLISWIEGRLDYLDGFLKPFNSILWWYLHRA